MLFNIELKSRTSLSVAQHLTHPVEKGEERNTGRERCNPGTYSVIRVQQANQRPSFKAQYVVFLGVTILLNLMAFVDFQNVFPYVSARQTITS